MTTTKTKTLSALTLVALLGAATYAAVPAGAQDAPPESPMGGMGPMGGMDMPRGMMLFEMVDADGNGTITAAEITAFRSAGVIGTDADGDGKLSAEELAAREVAMMSRMAAARAERRVAELDVDGDGLLSVEELAARPMPVFLLERLDANGDGAISRDEAEQAQARMRGDRGDRGGPGDGHRGRGPHGKGRGDHGND